MYIYIQQKINKFMILLLLCIVVILLGFCFLFKNHLINTITFVILFVLITFMFNYIIRFLEQNLEHHTIYKMLKRKQIALATIQSIEFYKESRDSSFTKKFIYKLHILMKTTESEVIEIDIYENIRDSQIDCLPGDVYVTFDKELKRIGIIPTLMIQMTPEIEPEIRHFEKMYETHYIVAIRKKGLSLKSITNVMKEIKNKKK